MLNNTEQANVPFTPDQQKQLDTFQSRLLLIQGEVKTAERIYSGLVQSLQTAQKDNTYFQGLVDNLKKEKADLDIQILEAKDVLSKSQAKTEAHRQELAGQVVALQDKQQAHSVEVQKFEANKADFVRQSQDLHVQAVAQELEKNDVLKAKSVFEEAIKQIPWLK